MVDKVSVALQASFRAAVAEGAGVPFEETGVAAPSPAVFERYARAAIEAMMPPTASMIAAGSAFHCQEYEAPIIWEEMIQAALKETA